MRLPGKILTVIIADESRFIHLQEPVTHRTVQIELTDDQRRQIALKRTGSLGRTDIYENISKVILEPLDDNEVQ